MPPVKYSIAVEKAAKLAQPKHMALAPPAQHSRQWTWHSTVVRHKPHLVSKRHVSYCTVTAYPHRQERRVLGSSSMPLRERCTTRCDTAEGGLRVLFIPVWPCGHIWVEKWHNLYHETSTCTPCCAVCRSCSLDEDVYPRPHTPYLVQP